MGKGICSVNTIMLCSVFGVRCSVFGVRCSVFGVRCSVKDCTGRILCVKGFSEKMLTFFAPEYIFFSHNLFVGLASPATRVNVTSISTHYNAFRRFV